MHQLEVAGDDRVGFLLKREQDVDAEAIGAARADVPGLHDSARRAGDDHVPGLGDLPAKPDRLLIRRMLSGQTRGAEYRYLAAAAVGSKHLEGVAQLFKGRAEQLYVAAVGAVAHQLVGRLLKLLHQLLDANGRPVIWMGFIVEVLKRGARLA